MGTKKSSAETEIHPALAQGGQMGATAAMDLFQANRPLPSMYAGVDPYRRRGMAQAAQIAGSGYGAETPALQNFQATQRGDYLFGNPYLDYNVQQAVRSAQGGLIGGFQQSGRAGSGVMAHALADAATRTAMGLYGQNYQMERDRMTQSLGLTPTMERMQYAGAGRLMDLGRMREADVTARQREDVRQYMWPHQRIAMLNQALSGSPLMAYRKTTQETPFDWTGAGLSMAGSLFSPSIPGMSGGGSKA